MPSISVSIAGVDADSRAQLLYAVAFASEAILSYRINDAAATIELQCATDEACAPVSRHVQELVERYQEREFGLTSVVEFSQHRDLPLVDAWSGLLDRKWVTPVGVGHVVLRGPVAQLIRVIDARINRVFVTCFGAHLETYPSTIQCTTLDRCKHFTAFPEHIDFVAHLKPDLAVLNRFAENCRDSGWSAEHHEGSMAESDLALSPSCCYHCYEGMEGWYLERPGRCVTATLGCHRFEGANHRTLSRLRAFTMREVVWIGEPSYVMAARAQAEQLILQWAREWELVGTFETANDMFFTQDYAVKASFQRQQQAKKELRLLIPAEDEPISVFSSNFHATTFGKAFNITAGGRPATSGCIGWGYERWAYALFSQFGFDFERWPAALKHECEQNQPGAWQWNQSALKG